MVIFLMLIDFLVLVVVSTAHVSSKEQFCVFFFFLLHNQNVTGCDNGINFENVATVDV